MSKLFFDHLIVLEDLEKEIKAVSQSQEEKEELWSLVDEIVHHKTLGCILDKLPQKNHQEFMEKFHKAPHDESLMEYLKDKVGQNIEELIKAEIGSLAFEILQEIKSKK